MRPLIVLAAAAALLAGCDDMAKQPRYESYEASRLFPDGKSLQAPPDGTVANDDPGFAKALADRPELDRALLERGEQRYAIYCSPCHGLAGDGNGRIPSRGFPRPPTFHQPRLRSASSRYFVDVITHGHGVMYSYADRVAPSDRWAIAAYIRALQLSQAMPVSALGPDERRKLAGTGS